MLYKQKNVRVALAVGAMMLPLGLASPQAFAQEISIDFSHFMGDSSASTPAVVDGVERFAAKYSDVEVVQNVSSQSEFMSQFQVAAAAGDVPDVFAMHGSWVTGLVERGLASDITDEFYADEDWGGITPQGVMFEFIRDDRVYAAPLVVNIPHVIYWNGALFEQAGIDGFPETWEGLLEAVDKLNSIGVTPISIGDKAQWVLVNVYLSTLTQRLYGDDFVADIFSGETDFLDPAHVESIARLKELVDRDAFNPDFASMDNVQQRDAYYRGEAAMFIEGNWVIPFIEQAAEPEILEATELAIWPSVNGMEEYASFTSGGAGWAWGISADIEGEEREAALNLVREVSNRDYAMKQLEIGLIPAPNVGDVSGVIEGSENSRLYAQMMGYLSDGTWKLTPVAGTNFPSSYLSVAGEALQDLFVGAKTPEEVAQAIQEDRERW